MLNIRHKRNISRLILIGLCIQLYQIRYVESNPVVLSWATSLPTIAGYVTGIATAYLSHNNICSKGMTEIAREIERICPTIAQAKIQDHIHEPAHQTIRQSKQPPQTQAPVRQETCAPGHTTISPNELQNFQNGIRTAGATLSQELGQRIRDNLLHMQKPQNFQMQTVPGGIRISHEGTGLHAQISMQPSQHSVARPAINWDALLAKLPQSQADMFRICHYMDEGNIEAAARVAWQSDSAQVKEQYAACVQQLLGRWFQDPLVKNLSRADRVMLLTHPQVLVEFYDHLLARDVVHHALCKAWNIQCDAPTIVKDTVYALCDTTQDGQLYCLPHLINQRLTDLISNAPTQHHQALIKAFYLPNGVLKDFGDHDIVKALEMPASILNSDNIKERHLVNNLVIAHITATGQSEQLVMLRAIANVKYVFSYPAMPQKMKNVFLHGAQLAYSSLKHRAHDVVGKFMVDAAHYKRLTKLIQIVAQTEIGTAKNILLGQELTCIARKQFDKAACHEYQLKGLDHAQTLIQKDLSKHALQLCYKIITANPRDFSKGVPTFTTVVKEGQQWVMRDMNGNALKVSDRSIKNPITRKANRYANRALRELDKLPITSEGDPLSQTNPVPVQQSTILHPEPKTSSGTGGYILPPQDLRPGCGAPPDDNSPFILSTPVPKPEKPQHPHDHPGIPTINEPGTGIPKPPLFYSETAESGKVNVDKPKDNVPATDSKPKAIDEKHPHGIYEDAPYHTAQGNKTKSKRPQDGQGALDISVPVPNKDDDNKKERRIGISSGEFVVMDETRTGQYHGHVREWKDLTPQMQNALVNAGYTNRKGKML